jgi:hypothetical protein
VRTAQPSLRPPSFQARYDLAFLCGQGFLKAAFGPGAVESWTADSPIAEADELALACHGTPNRLKTSFITPNQSSSVKAVLERSRAWFLMAASCQVLAHGPRDCGKRDDYCQPWRFSSQDANACVAVEGSGSRLVLGMSSVGDFWPDSGRLFRVTSGQATSRISVADRWSVSMASALSGVPLVGAKGSRKLLDLPSLEAIPVEADDGRMYLEYPIWLRAPRPSIGQLLEQYRQLLALQALDAGPNPGPSPPPPPPAPPPAPPEGVCVPLPPPNELIAAARRTEEVPADRAADVGYLIVDTFTRNGGEWHRSDKCELKASVVAFRSLDRRLIPDLGFTGRLEVWFDAEGRVFETRRIDDSPAPPYFPAGKVPRTESDLLKIATPLGATWRPMYAEAGWRVVDGARHLFVSYQFEVENSNPPQFTRVEVDALDGSLRDCQNAP